jgi:hypothetical protein
MPKVRSIRDWIRAARVLTQSTSELRLFHEAVRKVIQESRTDFLIEGHGRSINVLNVAADSVLRPFFDRHGWAMLVLWAIPPLFLSKQEYSSLRRDFWRIPMTRKIGSLRVHGEGRLDGGGASHAPLFVNYLKHRFPGRRFEHAFEWCCGLGYLGFALLEAGLCEKLFLADINPDAIAWVERTVAENGLGDKVTFCVSNNFAAIGADQRFDLVIGNPPWCYSKKDLYNERIANDPGWRIHQGFYASVRDHLSPDGIVCVGAFQPFEAEARLENGDLWDMRPRPPHDEFLEMIQRAGLTHLETIAPEGREDTVMGFGTYLLVSTRPASARLVRVPSTQ